MDDHIDFQYIYFRLKILKQRADSLMQAMTGLASIAGNRQNLEEAKRVKRLNLLALLFILLAYTSSFFSMSENCAPGAGQFWIYWVNAILVLAVTFLTTYILDTALGDAA
jgi:Mg2+ and Co2+ transporter CorA